MMQRMSDTDLYLLHNTAIEKQEQSLSYSPFTAPETMAACATISIAASNLVLIELALRQLEKP